jgi:hypothetical protein
MLKHSFLENPYVPNINSFLGGIEIYDREKNLGEELWRYDILPSLNYLSYRHRLVLLEKLGGLLSIESHNFSSYFEYLEEEYRSLTWYADEIVDPRGFLKDL